MLGKENRMKKTFKYIYTKILVERVPENYKKTEYQTNSNILILLQVQIETIHLLKQIFKQWNMHFVIHSEKYNIKFFSTYEVPLLKEQLKMFLAKALQKTEPEANFSLVMPFWKVKFQGVNSEGKKKETEKEEHQI